jgi:hypothetical protein
MIRGFLLSLALVALVACQSEGIPDSERPDGVLPDPVPEAQLDCPGGTVVQGLAGPTCAKPTPDAGKACTKPSDCTGACMAETMTCSDITPMFGCYEVVMEDGQKVGLCVD